MAKLKKTKDEITRKASELAVQYDAKHKGCAQCTFPATADALRQRGLEIVPQDMEDGFIWGMRLDCWRRLTGEGTCSAAASGALAIGVALGNPRDKQDAGLLWGAGGAVRDTVADKYYRQYGFILCRDVQRGFFAKARDLTDKA